MIRKLLAFISIVLFLTCAGIVALWVRSYRHANEEEDRFSWLHRGERYTVRCDGGKIALFRPPEGDASARASRRIEPAGDAVVDPLESRELTLQGPRIKSMSSCPTVAEAVAALDNEQLDLQVRAWLDLFPVPFKCYAQWTARVDSPTQLITYDGEFALDSDGQLTLVPKPPLFKVSDLIPSLLKALEDPNRFAAAHHVLVRVSPIYVFSGSLSFLQNKCADAGLNFQIVLPSQRTYVVWYEHKLVISASAFETQPDLAQLPVIRDQWHRRLDISVFSLPSWQLTVVTAFLPGLSFLTALRNRIRRRRRRRSGLCLVLCHSLIFGLQRL